MKKRVLLIGGGGTLGTYAAKELLDEGHEVDVICLEEKQSDREGLTFIRAAVTPEYLENFLAGRHYDGIVDFLWYKSLEEYIPFYTCLTAHTDRLIFLSSYRVYADEQHPITEDAPRLSDVVKDEKFLSQENYALPKSRCEDYIRAQTAFKGWTIVRPVISFSAARFDLFMYSGHTVPAYAREGKPLLLPERCRTQVAGLDWAGNTGRLIALLLFNPKAVGGVYTVSSGANLTWEQVAAAYTKLTGVRIEWVDEDTFLYQNPPYSFGAEFRYTYDRYYDRAVDNSRILTVTGLKKSDFTSIEDGLKIELARYNALYGEKGEA